ncbi:MAG: protein-glutamate O-methyltransferase CheR [Spirochaetales bacterium]|nr:protein-glutamate O-methyltransferase CheR [Spirochaetales bacterium]
MENYLNDIDFGKFRDLIYDASGIHFSESNRVILESRLKEKLRKSELSSPGEYYSILTRDKEELKQLLDSVTTNLTRFFRNTAHFETLENYVFPELVKLKRETGSNKIKIWSAGCSTGEEPYSIAMMAKEVLPPGMSVEVTASDLSLKSLMTAKAGFYPNNRVNGIPDKYLTKYFNQSDDGYMVKDEIKNLIKFDYHNLKFDSGNRNLDIVLCRNVIIYFDDAAQEAVIQKFWDSMNRKSFLFIGHSESLFGMKTQFEFFKSDWACIYLKTS